MELYILAFLGILLHFVMLYDSARRKSDFAWSIFINNNAVMFIVSFVVSGLIVYQYNVATQEVSAIVSRFLGDYAACIQIGMFLVGYNAGDIWYRINKAFRDIFKTSK